MEGASATPSRLDGGLGALLHLLASEPEVARLVLIDVRAAGGASRAAQQRLLDDLARLAEAHCEAATGARGEAVVARIVVGSMATLLAAVVARSSDPRRARPDLTFVGLAPCVGAEAAATAMRRCQLRLIANPATATVPHDVAQM